VGNVCQRVFFGKYIDHLSTLVFIKLQLLSAVVTSDWRDVVTSCDLENWKEALASLLTYANAEEMKILCGKLFDV